jgi:hypothetical protein
MCRIALAGVLFLAACTTSSHPQQVVPLTLGAAGDGSFGFLPPLTSGGPAIAPLAEDLSPTLVISQLSSSSAPLEVARFEALTHVPGCCYAVQWDTTGLALTGATGFLLDVQVDGGSVGSMTVQVVASSGDLAGIDTTTSAGAVRGQVLDVRAAIGPCAGVTCAPKACQTGTCTNGACHYQPAADGLACDDHSLCTTGDACKAGACVGQTLDCTDGTVCTTDSCDAQKGCVHTPVADGLACPNSGCGGTASCKAGLCDVQSAPAFCDDGNGCTAEACLGNGVCAHTAIPTCSQRLVATWDVNEPAQLMLTGADFQPGEQVSVALDGVQVGPVTAAADGTLTFVASLTGPPASVGLHGAVAVGQTGSVSTAYTVLALPTFELVVAGVGNVGDEILASEHLLGAVGALQPFEHVFYAVDASATDPHLNVAADGSGQVRLDGLATSSLGSGPHVLRIFDTSVSHWHAEHTFLIRRPVIAPIADVQVGDGYQVTLSDFPVGRPLQLSAADQAGNAEGDVTVTPAGASSQASLTVLPTAPVGDWTLSWRDPAASLTRHGTLSFHVVHNDAHAGSWASLAQTSLHHGEQVGVNATFLGASEGVTFSLEGVPAGQAQATAGGVLTGVAVVPTDAPLGNHTLSASGDAGSSHAWVVRVLNDVAWGLTATPARVGAGGSVTVHGVGGLPDELASVEVLGADGGVLVSQGGLAPDDGGGFTVALAVPMGTPGGTLGVSAEHTVGGVSQGPSATASFTYGAQLTVTPSSATPGATLHLTGDGFAPSESISVTFDGVVALTTTSSASGAITVDLLFSNPAGTPQHQLVATGSTSLLSASATVSASAFCDGVQVSTISGSGDAGFDDGTGGPPDLGTTWRAPWGLAVVPGSSPRKLWVADQGNGAVRELIAEPGDTGQTRTVAIDIADATPAIPFGDVRGLAVAVDNYGPFQQAILADAAQTCFLRRFDQRSDWHVFSPNCDAEAVSPVAVYTFLDAPNGARQLYFGALDDGLGCVVEAQPEFERHLRRACRPAGSGVKLEAIAVDGNNVLYTNNWLSTDGGAPEGVMRIEGYLETGNADSNPPLQQSVLVTRTGGRALHASALVVGGDGYLYLADATAGALYRVSLDGAEVLLLAGGQGPGAPFADGTGCQASFSQPRGLAWAQSATGPVLYVTDSGNHRVRRLALPP